MHAHRRCGLFLGLLALAGLSEAQPLAPELSLTINAPDVPATGRFEFAKLPELVFVRGIAQVAQMGFYQLDPANPWPAGDVERASGWLSNRLTRLVDNASGQPVNPSILGYQESSGEVSYAGSWSGDLTVRLETQDGAVRSVPFRIRVMTPTVVWGDNALAVNQAHGWAAKVCRVETTSFAVCRQGFVGGNSDTAPLVVFITSGTYPGQDFYVSTRRFTYVLGDPGTRPTLIGDELSGGKKQMFYVANLTLKNTGIVNTGALPGAPNTMIIRSVYQCCEDRDNNGLSNPNKTANDYLWSVYWHASESRGMGGVGNTTHPAYVEGRPKSLFDVNNIRILGSRGASGVKTTVNELNVRHSLLQVAEDLGEIANGTCINPGLSSGCLMHTPIDFPGFTSATIYANKFVVWRGPTGGGTPPGRSGVLTATIFVRQRGPSYGSDTPNYPNKSWNPPESTQTQRMQGFCNQWAPTAPTFVSDKFWQDVRSKPLTDATNPCTFKHFISYNTFVQLPGSLNVYAVRDDGTYPAKATSQFSPTVNIYRNHPNWAERSTSFLYGNTFDGYGETQQKFEIDRDPNIKYIYAGAQWPRTPPDQYPRVIDVTTQELPAWFKL